MRYSNLSLLNKRQMRRALLDQIRSNIPNVDKAVKSPTNGWALVAAKTDIYNPITGRAVLNRGMMTLVSVVPTDPEQKPKWHEAWSPSTRQIELIDWADFVLV